MLTYRVFDTLGQCNAYCAQMFVSMVRARAATMTRQELHDHWNLPTKARIPELPDHVITGSRFPLYGRNQLTREWNTTAGFTTAWDKPRETANGQWAAQALDPDDPDAVPEPEWPPVDDLIGG